MQHMHVVTPHLAHQEITLTAAGRQAGQGRGEGKPREGGRSPLTQTEGRSPLTLTEYVTEKRSHSE